MQKAHTIKKMCFSHAKGHMALSETGGLQEFS
jgi:hypothetical protein